MAVIAVGSGELVPTPWAARPSPGDTVIVKAGVYRGKLICGTAGVTWKFEPGAVINGGWNGKTIITGFQTQVEVAAPGVSISGLTVRDCPGRGILVGASDVTVDRCHVENTYHGAIAVIGDGQPISGVKVLNSVFTQMSRSWEVGDRPDVNGGVQIHNTTDSLISGNHLSYGWGECFNVGRNSKRVVVEGNTAHSFNHALLYFNRCQDCTARDNMLYHLPDAPQVQDRDEAAAGIVFGDERGPKLDKYAFQSGNVVMGNLVVNCGKLLQVRNNALSGAGAGYDTQLKGTRIENNTFVAGPLTLTGISILENMRGRRHEGSVFRGNVIYGTAANMCNAPGVTFAGNGWTHLPPASMRGAGDVVGDLALVNPAPPVGAIAPGNYRPRPSSPLVREGGYIGALPPQVDEPPVDDDDDGTVPDGPPPAPVDVAAIRDCLAAVRDRLDTTGADLALAVATLERAVDEFTVAVEKLASIDELLDAA